MERIDAVRALQARADAERAAGCRIALVPTMGALHEGHRALVRAAREHADRVWVSIFVNPTQFDDPADLAGYPRTLERDLEICREEDADVAFVPEAADIHPEGADTSVEVGALSRPLCGAARPGHFRGVTTVVAKLLLAAKPHVAVFGEKDFQQLAVVRRMVRDLRFDVEILGVPTVREPDGVALSSRNANLDAEGRAQAPVLVRALEAAESAVAAGERSAPRLLARVRAEIAKAPRAEIDYAELRDPETLDPAPDPLEGPALLALAVFIRPPGSGEGRSVRQVRSGRSGRPVRPVRLIDNRVLRPQPRGGGSS